MNWLNRLEQKFGRHGIPNLMMYVSTTTLVAFLLQALAGMPVIQWLYFDRELILQGQIWRLITFIFVPMTYQLFSLLLMLYFYYWIGSRLEYAWGVFRFNLYYLFGIIGIIIAGFISGGSSLGSATYLNLSLFLAYAQLFPEEQILLMMFLPIKVKYIAYVDWAIFAASLIFQPGSTKLAIVAVLLNFFIFFWPNISKSIRDYFRFRKVRNNFRNEMRRNNVVKGPWDNQGR